MKKINCPKCKKKVYKSKNGELFDSLDGMMIKHSSICSVDLENIWK